MLASSHTFRLARAASAATKSHPFTSSATHRLPFRPKTRGSVTPPSKSAEADLLRDIRCPECSHNVAHTKYFTFMDKLEKLNPGVQFTKELADMALAKSINAKMPRNLHEHTRTFLQGSKLRMARGIYSSNVQDYRRLHAESNEYWTMQGASGDDQDESVE